jgi:hypothetical protein
VIPDETRDESQHEGHYYDDKLLHCYTPTHMERGITRCAQPSLGDLTEFSARVTVGVMAIRPSALVREPLFLTSRNRRKTLREKHHLGVRGTVWGYIDEHRRWHGLARPVSMLAAHSTPRSWPTACSSQRRFRADLRARLQAPTRERRRRPSRQHGMPDVPGQGARTNPRGLRDKMPALRRPWLD